MNISHLNEFVVLARCLNFTTAAQRLGISQPALSKHLMSLEDDLGVSLFERDKRHMRLTPSGAYVLEKASEITLEYESMRQRARSIEKQHRRKLTVETLNSYQMFREVLRVTAEDLQRSTPPLTILEKEFELTAERLVLDHLADGAVDIAIFPEIFTHVDARFHRVHLYKEHLGVLIPADSPLAKKDHLFAGDLDGIPVWVPCAPDSTSYMQGIEQMFSQMDSAPLFKGKYEYDYTRSGAFSFPDGVYVNCYELFMGNLPALLRNDYKCMKIENDSMFIWIDAVWGKQSNEDWINCFLTALRKRLAQLGNSIEIFEISDNKGLLR